jgi:hypothetical protein
VRDLPWGGGFCWDGPILIHVERVALDPAFPRADCMLALAVATELMTVAGNRPRPRRIGATGCAASNHKLRCR